MTRCWRRAERRQDELPFDPSDLVDEQRVELAVHVIDGWQRMSACRSVVDDTWFPHRSGDVRAALAVCVGCPVRRSCLAHALGADEWYGVRGGTTEATRHYLRLDLAEGAPVDAVLGCADSTSWRARA
jgi:hypothetical protein